MMTAEDIQELLATISQALGAIKDFPVFEEITDRGSYYTMSDYTMSDAIQALNEIVCGMESVNSSEGGLLPSTILLTRELKESIKSLSEISAAILRADYASRPSEDKAAAQGAAREAGYDIHNW